MFFDNNLTILSVHNCGESYRLSKKILLIAVVIIKKYF